MNSDVFEALPEEYAAITAMLDSLTDEQWATESLCAGWTVADVVLHLAQSEESVLVSIGVAGNETGFTRTVSGETSGNDAPAGGTIDDLVEAWVASERGKQTSRELRDRWVEASSTVLDTLKNADPGQTFSWATNPLKPRTLCTTRLSEHWIHANDIAIPAGYPYPDTDRIWHIARLAHRTVPYAYRRDGRTEAAPTVRAELLSPREERWDFGDVGADVTIRGSASEFVRIAGRRLDPADAKTIVTEGDRAAEVLELIRTYA